MLRDLAMLPFLVWRRLFRAALLERGTRAKNKNAE
jgi:hypothetical protein